MSDNERNEHNRQEGLSSLVRQHMDQTTQELDPTITARLAAGRQQALKQMGQEPRGRSRTTLTGFGLAASVAMVAVLASFYTGNERPTGPVSEADALEMMAAEEPLELYEDLEFYLWLEQQEMPGESRSKAG